MEPPTSFAAALAKKAIETYIRDKRVLDVPSLIPEELAGAAGVFVSLKENSRLRGCIGTIEPVQENAAAEIIQNAISSAVGDPRFPPVSEDELDGLAYSVDILSGEEPVESAAELDPKKFGLIVEAAGRRGLLLPDIEGVETVEEQIAICRQKAGLGPDEMIQMKRFLVTRYR